MKTMAVESVRFSGMYNNSYSLLQNGHIIQRELPPYLLPSSLNTFVSLQVMNGVSYYTNFSKMVGK